jgi:putative ABC transport system ATP-binding protein
MVGNIVSINNLTKKYKSGAGELIALNNVSLELKEGEFLAITGRSGSGKSTLLYQLGLLDNPSSGEIYLEGVKVSHMSDTERSRFRLEELGYVFQDYALLPELQAWENVALPDLMKGKNIEEAKKIAFEVLEKVGMKGKEKNLPSELSGGQQQRVSIARAVAHKPKILFADEPTANLDSTSSKQVIELFKQLNKEGQTIIMVTHEEEYASECDKVIMLADGMIM